MLWQRKAKYPGSLRGKRSVCIRLIKRSAALQCTCLISVLSTSLIRSLGAQWEFTVSVWADVFMTPARAIKVLPRRGLINVRWRCLSVLNSVAWCAFFGNNGSCRLDELSDYLYVLCFISSCVCGASFFYLLNIAIKRSAVPRWSNSFHQCYSSVSRALNWKCRLPGFVPGDRRLCISEIRY